MKNIEIVEQIETLLVDLKKSLGAKFSNVASNSTEVKSGAEFSGLAGEINNLVLEGFFKEPRTISEIQTRLRQEGIKKPTTSLAGPLLRLIRKKVLSRNKPTDAKGTFKYSER